MSIRRDLEGYTSNRRPGSFLGMGYRKEWKKLSFLLAVFWSGLSAGLPLPTEGTIGLVKVK